MLPEPLQVVQRLIETFDQLGIAYLVGGSVASSVVGVERATQDVDFVVALTETQVETLTQALTDEFYADADLLRWYRLTGERSEKQWGDVQGIFRIQQAALDQSYLTDWAKELELTDLLMRAREEAGVR